MKIYVYPTPAERRGFYVVRALTDSGQPVVESAATREADIDEIVEKIKEHALSVYPGASVVWVWTPDQHPVLWSLINPPAGQDQNTHDPGVAICASCTHERVCSVAREASTIGAIISFCPEFTEVQST